ncbi:Fe(2+) transporter permease subunit FeoB [Photobacterium sp. 1_MG-2023]|uniref:Fe(2+) transporter permease subunit FeoB n=1 Tax=Photobacterium sp. 1_MG-2023 TaxID=3062646 RepID=UPI0026E288B4|nr:Fe(2+) transporter permease subunit FeoB [Photobacterium sp. 1_MG-2023]MDO6705732.1 Fe(2+) transporter permease subunit FeoB [Photobacterium sp. 1_MG-2023]
MTSHIMLTIGNPNSGKTTLFNGLTGARQKVGNWPGVTVDKKTGRYTMQDCQYVMTDLPGLYQLNSNAAGAGLDEAIASQVVMTEPADVVLNVVDATCLERGLYLTLQLLELGLPVVVVLNKMDVLQANREQINTEQLAVCLGCPVFTVAANQAESVAAFKRELAQVLAAPDWQVSKGRRTPPRFEAAIEAEVAVLLKSGLATITGSDRFLAARGIALRMLEGDDLLLDVQTQGFQQAVHQSRLNLASQIDPEISFAETRYSFLHQLCTQVRRQQGQCSLAASDTIDRWVLHPWLGLPILMLVMYLMFLVSINVGSALIDFFDIGVGIVLVDGGHHVLDGRLPAWLVTILCDGMGGGIQTVATFIPVIACLYLMLTLLESSGYMARAAFVLDKLMQKIGLPGKAFVPLVLGFGCNVPAIMATRTLEQERERQLAAAMAPFMSCGARLPVYALFAAAFFPHHGQHLVFALYLAGILAAVLTGLLLRHTLWPGSSEVLIMEIPRYEWPQTSAVLMLTWHKLKRFVLGAGKTIVLVVTLLSFLNSIGTDGTFGHEDSPDSVLAKTAQLATPLLSPLGIQQENWPATVGIMTGLFAKEAVVGTLNSLYAKQDSSDAPYDLWGGLQAAVLSVPENLAALNYSDPLGMSVGDVDDSALAASEQGVSVSVYDSLRTGFSSEAAALSYLIFILLYTPCVAAMGAYAREFGRRFAMLVAAWTMWLAFSLSTLCYQVAQLGSGSSATWIAVVVVLNGLVVLALKCYGQRQGGQGLTRVLL